MNKITIYFFIKHKKKSDSPPSICSAMHLFKPFVSLCKLFANVLRLNTP